MTRKDYALIASVIAARIEFAKQPGVADGPNRVFELGLLATDLAVMLSRDNPRFNRSKFFAACKVDNG